MFHTCLAFSPLGAFLPRDARLTWGTLGVTALLPVLSYLTLGNAGMAALGGVIGVVGLLFVQVASLTGTWCFPYPLLFRGEAGP